MRAKTVIKLPPKRKLVNSNIKGRNTQEYQCDKCDLTTKYRHSTKAHESKTWKTSQNDKKETDGFPDTITRIISTTTSMKSPTSKISRLEIEIKDDIMNIDVKEDTKEIETKEAVIEAKEDTPKTKKI